MKKLTIRLDKYLANVGLTSRRGVDELLKKNEVLINQKRAKEGGIRLNPEKDNILINGKELKKDSHLAYFILNKPKGVLSAAFDPTGRKTVVDLVKTGVRVYPVGRLDADSIGLIILTSDGELAHKLTHPKFHIPKTYQVIISGTVGGGQLNRLRKGVTLKDGMTAPADVEVLQEYGATTKLKIVLYEGRNRQIRRMCAKLDMQLLELKRVAIGPIEMGNLGLGKSRELTEKEVKQLKESVGIN